MTQFSVDLMSIVGPVVLSWLGVIVTPLIRSGVSYLEAKASAKSELGKTLADNGFFTQLSDVAVDAVHYAEQLASVQLKGGVKLSSADRKQMALDYALKAMGSAQVPASANGSLSELLANSIETALHKESVKGAL